jgi:hypothetical protein
MTADKGILLFKGMQRAQRQFTHGRSIPNCSSNGRYSSREEGSGAAELWS